MTQYKSNLFANFAGSGVAALLQLAFIPFYIKFLGIEAYGLIGFYILLQAVLQVLDLGLGPTMNREMARYSVQPDKAGEARDFTRTLEIGYWILGISALISDSFTRKRTSRHYSKYAIRVDINLSLYAT